MQPQQGQQDYKKLLTDVIKKQIVILGPGITLAKARNVKGLTVADDGTVTNMQGQPQELIQALIDQFVQLSGLIVKKTMEPLLSVYPDGAATVINPAAGTGPQIIQNQGTEVNTNQNV
ncbi:MAG TPA: hypothetical protein VKC89_02310 [Patescibacteria group bacterium]|nr:hypothetical protein [Patescibacteria group bacterium]